MNNNSMTIRANGICGILVGIMLLFSAIVDANPLKIIIAILWYWMGVYEFNTETIVDNISISFARCMFGLVVIVGTIFLGILTQNLCFILMSILWTVKFNLHYFCNAVVYHIVEIKIGNNQ